MKKSTIILIISFTALLILEFVWLKTMPSVPVETKLEQKVYTLHKKDVLLEQKFDRHKDSISMENAALRRANKTILKSITNIFIQNEKEKQRAFGAGDSVKHYISDSMLRANGY